MLVMTYELTPLINFPSSATSHSLGLCYTTLFSFFSYVLLWESSLMEEEMISLYFYMATTLEETFNWTKENSPDIEIKRQPLSSS